MSIWARFRRPSGKRRTGEGVGQGLNNDTDGCPWPLFRMLAEDPCDDIPRLAANPGRRDAAPRSRDPVAGSVGKRQRIRNACNVPCASVFPVHAVTHGQKSPASHKARSRFLRPGRAGQQRSDEGH